MSKRSARKHAQDTSRKSADQRDGRFERWLADVADGLGHHGLDCRLGYDDRHFGDRMYLAITAPARGERGPGQLELAMCRGGRSRAIVYLFAETRAGVRALAEALDGSHRRVPRARNAKRKFMHLLERLAVRLTATFDQRALAYPRPVLARLQAHLPDARAMVGIADHQHLKGGPKLDAMEHAALVPVSVPAAGDPGDPASTGPLETVWRALRYDPDREAFEAYGPTRAALEAAIPAQAAAGATADRADAAWASLGGGAAAGMAGGLAGGLIVAGALHPALAQEHRKKQGDDSGGDTDSSCLDWLDCGDLVHSVTCDSCDIGLSDLGPCDTPDCDVCDVPDIDCGGCDL